MIFNYINIAFNRILKVLNINLMIVLFSTLLFVPRVLFAEQTIKVGGYLFPPFVVQDEDGSLSGTTLDLIDLLNATQDEYYFEFYFTTPTRRYMELAAGKYDVMFFEDKQWGWSGYDVQETKKLIESNQVYIANRQKAEGQSYFTSLAHKLILGVRGYNYGFANFISDPKSISRMFNVRLVTSPDLILPLVIKNKVDVSVISGSYVLQKSLQDPEILSSIIISEKIDRSSRLGVLVSKYADISVESFNSIIDRLITDKTFEIFWLQQYLEIST